MNTIRRILWQRLDADVTTALGPGWTKKKIVLYGAGGLGLSFMQTFPQLPIAYVVDSDPRRRGERFHGIPVETPDALKAEDPDRLVVFITSAWHQEIRRTLESLGLEHRRQIFYGGQQAHGRIFFHLRDLADFGKAFAWLEERGVEHVVLRWFETLPAERPVDVDLLLRTSQLEQLFESPFLSSSPGGVPIEVYWDRPLGQEDELLYYPSWLADQILRSRQRLPSGAWAPSGRDLSPLARLSRRFSHKAERSKLPIDEGAPIVAEPNKYLEKLDELSRRSGTALESTLDGLWSFLEREDWLPPIDLARRYATTLRSPWLTGRWARSRARRRTCSSSSSATGWSAIPRSSSASSRRSRRRGSFGSDRGARSGVQCVRAHERIRGGNWVETEASRKGGGPAAFGIFFDPAPERPGERDRLLRPFCRNRKLGFKSELKQQIARDCNGGRVVNFLHAADDEREAFEYLSCLEPARHAAARTAIDRIRRIAARRCG